VARCEYRKCVKRKKVTIDVNKRVYRENDNKQTLAHIDYKR